MEAMQSVKFDSDARAEAYSTSTSNERNGKEINFQFKIPEKKAEAADSSKGAVDERRIEDVAKGLNNFLESIQTDLRVEIHSETKTAVFKIIKKGSDEVIKEIPPKEMLYLAVKIKETLGNLIDTNV